MVEIASNNVALPQMDTMGAFAQGATAAENVQNSEMARARQGMEMIASAAYGVLDGNLNGQADPAKWEQTLDYFQAKGIPVDALRGKPHMANVVAQSSLDVLKTAQDERMFQLQLQKFEQDIANAATGPKPTSEQQEYQMAVDQGFTGTFMDYKAATRAPGTTVNVGPNGTDYGDPGAGLVWKRDAQNNIIIDERGAPIAIPFQGGKPYADQQAAESAAAAGDQRQTLKANVVVQDIDRALDQIEANPLMTTGIGAQLTGGIGGSPAANVGELLNTVKANAGFEELQAMREASPTGGALGNITEKEIAYLQATIGSLAQSQGDKQLIDNLKRVKNAYLDIIHGVGNGPPRETLSFEDDDLDPATMSDEDLLTFLGAN